MELRSVLAVVLLLGAKVLSCPNLAKEAQKMANHGKEKLKHYHEAISSKLPALEENVTSVGDIHRPDQNASAVMKSTILLFHCYMKEAIQFPLQKEEKKGFEEIAQKISHLQESLIGHGKATCKPITHLKHDSTKFEFGAKLLILYVQWMEKLQVLLSDHHCKQAKSKRLK
ncbi:hypothetical protein GN956_G9441 [Arapaima gigas]